MKSQDIVVWTKIFITGPESLYLPRVAHELFMSRSEVYNSVKRLHDSGLLREGAGRDKHIPLHESMKEFLFHGFRYVFPSNGGREARGMATAHSAPLLRERFHIDPGESLYVWPYKLGNIRGQSVDPLFPTVPEASERDDELYLFLALIDCLRLGRAREINLSRETLSGLFEKHAGKFHAVSQ